MKTFEILCGGASPGEARPHVTRLAMDIQGPRPNVNLKVAGLSRLKAVPDVLIDLLEIAAYVYCADQRTRRGGDKLSDAGSAWRRHLRFTIPVRRPELWERPELVDALETTLGFLSDDHYDFRFEQARPPLVAHQAHFDLGEPSKSFPAQEIALFSGGLDSLAGALDSIVGEGRRTVLVGHRSAPKVFAAQKDLIRALRRAGHGGRLCFLPVNVTNAHLEPTEATQRSRSFLFASLAFVVAQFFGRDGFTFFENGVVSLNLPIAHDVVGARATRTTHPKVVRGFEQVFSTLVDRSIEIRTPYLSFTKTEIVEKIVVRGFGQLLPLTVSCIHPISWTRGVRHCGCCSQCIDRRFAVLAAGAGELDPADGYKVDLLTGARTDDQDIRMAVAYVKFARELCCSDRQRFARENPDVYAAAGHVPGIGCEGAVDGFWDVHRRHAEAVMSVIEQGLKQHAGAIAQDALPRGALLRLSVSREQIEAPPIADTGAQMAAFMDRLSEPVCHFAVDEANRRILFPGGFHLDGDDYWLVYALWPNHRDAKREGRDVPHLEASLLQKRLGLKEEASLRKAISRVRQRAIARLAVDQGIVFEPDGFIENKRGEGYRLAPELRELSLGDLLALGPMSRNA